MQGLCLRHLCRLYSMYENMARLEPRRWDAILTSVPSQTRVCVCRAAMLHVTAASCWVAEAPLFSRLAAGFCLGAALPVAAHWAQLESSGAAEARFLCVFTLRDAAEFLLCFLTRCNLCFAALFIRVALEAVGCGRQYIFKTKVVWEKMTTGRFFLNLTLLLSNNKNTSL